MQITTGKIETSFSYSSAALNQKREPKRRRRRRPRQKQQIISGKAFQPSKKGNPPPSPRLASPRPPKRFEPKPARTQTQRTLTRARKPTAGPERLVVPKRRRRRHQPNRQPNGSDLVVAPWRRAKKARAPKGKQMIRLIYQKWWGPLSSSCAPLWVARRSGTREVGYLSGGWWGDSRLNQEEEEDTRRSDGKMTNSCDKARARQYLTRAPLRPTNQ